MAATIDIDRRLAEAKQSLAGFCNDAPPGVARALTVVLVGLTEASDAIARLAKRIAELEAAPLAYDGVWEAGKAYAKGTFVTFAGSVWHANYKSASKPGDGPAWTLAVKAGRDAR